MIKHVDKDDLFPAARCIAVADTLAQDVWELFFSVFDPNDKNQHLGILWEFNRNQRRMEAILDQIYAANQELKKLGISYQMMEENS
jgi:hypothetical protein